jgi:molybdopterin converting factor small subunit
MILNVLFFGATADAVGERKVQFDVRDDATAADAFTEIVAAYPQLRPHKLLFSVNEEYVDGDQIVNPGDELAVFTAVSGG